MAALGFLFFLGVLGASLWTIFATVAPRSNYIAALLSGSSAAPMLVPVAQRRRVRRINSPVVRSGAAPGSGLGSGLGSLRAAA